MKIKKSNLLLIIVLFIFVGTGFLFLHYIGNEQLEETLPTVQFFADSNTYIKTYRGEGDEGAVIRVDGNYLGPITILNILQGNSYLILLFNVLVFAISIICIANNLKIDSLWVSIFLLISPLTISTLLSVNKEIFLFPFLALAIAAFLRKSILLFLMALFIALMVRWQLAIFYLVLILIIRWGAAFFTRAKILIGILATLSIVYLALIPIIEPVLQYVQLSFDNYDDIGSGLFRGVLELQNSGLYFLVFPIKAFHLLFGMGFKIDKILNPIDLYNDFFVAGHCLIAFLVFSLLIIKRKLSIKSDLIFVTGVFLIFFCITPIFSPRYLYFAFVLGVLVLAGAPDDLRALQLQRGARKNYA